MHSACRTIALCCLLAIVGYAQTGSPTAAQLEAFENFASQPTAHVIWSRETGKIDSDQAHAVITALEVEDAERTPHRMRGVRIDLRDQDVKDQVYTSEEFLERLIKALDEISAVPSDTRYSNNRCFGSGIFWLQSGHAFSASQCVFGVWSGLSVSTGRHSAIRFTGLDSTPFAAAIGRARDELKQR